MDRLSIVKKLETQQVSVYTRQQFAAALGLDNDYAAVLLSRMVDDDVIVRIMRGKYCLPDTSILCIASCIYPPSYVSLWKAYEYYGTTTQMPIRTDVICTKRPHTIHLNMETGRFKIRFIKAHPSKIFGFRKERIDGKIAFIAEKERAVIDGLQYMNYLPLSETYEAISIGIDPRRVIDFARRIGIQTVMKRTGFLLEKAGFPCSTKSFGKLSKTYIPLDPALPKRGKYDSKWKIIENTVIE